MTSKYFSEIPKALRISLFTSLFLAKATVPLLDTVGAEKQYLCLHHHRTPALSACAFVCERVQGHADATGLWKSKAVSVSGRCAEARLFACRPVLIRLTCYDNRRGRHTKKDRAWTLCDSSLTATRGTDPACACVHWRFFALQCLGSRAAILPRLQSFGTDDDLV